MEKIAFRFNLQKLINLKRYECKRSFELVTRKDLPLFLFDIVAIATMASLFSILDLLDEENISGAPQW